MLNILKAAVNGPEPTPAPQPVQAAPVQYVQPQYVQPAPVLMTAPWKVIMDDEYLNCCADSGTALMSTCCFCCVAGSISGDINRSCCCGAICYVFGCWSCHRSEVQRFLPGVEESSCCTNCCVNAWFGCCIASLPQSKRAIAAYKTHQSTAGMVAVPAQPMVMQQQQVMYR